MCWICLTEEPYDRKRMQIIVDGYNLLHALGRMRNIRSPGTLQLRREWLVGFLADALPGLRPHIVIVFDCSNPLRGPAQQQSQHGIRLYFVDQPKEQADDVIEDMLRKTPQPRRVIVVSDDNRLLVATRRHRAVAMKCEQFLDWLEQKPGQRNRHGWPAWVDEVRSQAATHPSAKETSRSAHGGKFDAPADEPSEKRKRPSEAEQRHWLEVFKTLEDDPTLGQPPYRFEE